MSQQADALNGVLRQAQVPFVPPPAETPQPGREDWQKLPEIRLPGDNSFVGPFAKEVGAVMRESGLFARDNVPVTINPIDGRVEAMSPEAFISYADDYLACYQVRYSAEGIPRKKFHSMSRAQAVECLASHRFLSQLRPVQRVNQVPLPVMRRTGPSAGRIELLQPGYDEESQTFTQDMGVQVKLDMPADEAAFFLRDLLSEFPIVDRKEGKSRSEAVIVAAMLSIFAAGLQNLTARRLNFCFNANEVGSGKTLLAQLCVVPVCGRAEIGPLPDKGEELTKLLDTAALAASPYIIFDDLSGFLKSTKLNAFTTASHWTGRILGGQKKFVAPKISTVFLTGNNLDLSPDLGRRMLRADLFVEQTDIQERVTSRVMDEEYLTQPGVRGDILAALWALVRSWDEAKRPRASRVMLGYHDWAHIYGAIVEHAGFGCPLDPPPKESAGVSEDADRQVLIEALAAEMTGDRGEFEFDEIVQLAWKTNCFGFVLDGKEKEETLGSGKRIDLTQKAKSMFGKILTDKMGGRSFWVGAGAAKRQLRFGARGKHRGRRYEVIVVK